MLSRLLMVNLNAQIQYFLPVKHLHMVASRDAYGLYLAVRQSQEGLYPFCQILLPDQFV